MHDETYTEQQTTSGSFRDRIAAGAKVREGSQQITDRIESALARRAFSAGYAQALLDMTQNDRDGVATFLSLIAGDAAE